MQLSPGVGSPPGPPGDLEDDEGLKHLQQVGWEREAYECFRDPPTRERKPCFFCPCLGSRLCPIPLSLADPIPISAPSLSCCGCDWAVEASLSPWSPRRRRSLWHPCRTAHWRRSSSRPPCRLRACATLQLPLPSLSAMAQPGSGSTRTHRGKSKVPRRRGQAGGTAGGRGTPLFSFRASLAQLSDG